MSDSPAKKLLDGKPMMFLQDRHLLVPGLHDQLVRSLGTSLRKEALRKTSERKLAGWIHHLPSGATLVSSHILVTDFSLADALTKTARLTVLACQIRRFRGKLNRRRQN